MGDQRTIEWSNEDDRMDGCWCCGHHMLFRGRSEDKEELDESVFEEQQKKGYICPQFYFYCRSIIYRWSIYLYIFIYVSFFRSFFFLFLI